MAALQTVKWTPSPPLPQNFSLSSSPVPKLIMERSCYPDSCAFGSQATKAIRPSIFVKIYFFLALDPKLSCLKTLSMQKCKQWESKWRLNKLKLQPYWNFSKNPKMLPKSQALLLYQNPHANQQPKRKRSKKSGAHSISPTIFINGR